MAFFSDSELIASIRHELRVEDDSSICARLLPPVPRRAKFGGVPLNFRTALDEDDDENQQYEFPLDVESEPTPTSEVISGRLRSRTTDSAFNAEGIASVDDKLGADDLFVVTSLKSHDGSTSAVSRFLSSDAASSNTWIEYGKFQVMGEGPARSLHIIYTVDEDHIHLPIRVKPSAKVYQVIGLCCLVYSIKKGIVLSGNYTDYQLYMADESGDVDWEFSPMESGRIIGELGFDYLALARRRGPKHQGYTVKVYFVTSECFTFELQTLDDSLGWLRDEAIKRRLEKMTEEKRDQFLLIPDYQMETADDFDVKLDPEKSIASTHSLEFVLIRKNSSRIGFHPRGLSPRHSQVFSPGPLSPRTPSEKKSSMAMFEFPGGVTFRRQSSVRPQSMSVSSQQSSSVDMEPLKEWKVERLHKYKPKWTARLVLRWNCLEICAIQVEEKRRSIVPTPAPKQVVLPWENVAGAMLIERKTNTDVIPVVLIYTLPLLDQKMLTSAIGSEAEMKVKDIGRLYDTAHWKVFQLECSSCEEADDIVQNIQEICKGCESVSYKIFCHSAGGARRPAVAADACLLQSTEGPVLSSLSGRKKSRFQKFKRMISSTGE